MVFTTSVNHWRNPKPGPRRNLDIATTFVVGLYNIYRHPTLWVPVNSSCLFVWYLSNKYRDRRIHSLMHVVAVSAYLLENNFTSSL